MKHTLTPAQIVLLPSALCEAVASYERHLEELNGHAPASAAYWREEAAKVRALKALLDDAIQIDVTTATPATPLSETDLAAPHWESNPTDLPSPSPRAQRLASTLSKLTLRTLLGFPQPLPDHVLASRCNTIVRSRGETAPLDARDLQAAAKLQWQQRGYKPHLPHLTQAPEECPESRAETLAAPAHSSAPVPHPNTAAVPSKSSPDSAPGR